MVAVLRPLMVVLCDKDQLSPVERERGREGSVAATQSLEHFNAISVLIGVPCVFLNYCKIHLCSRRSTAFLRCVYSIIVPCSSPLLFHHGQPSCLGVAQMCKSNFCKRICGVQHGMNKKRDSALCNPSQASRSHLQTQPSAKKITLSNQPSICQKYHYRVISNGSAARVYLFPK